MSIVNKIALHWEINKEGMKRIAAKTSGKYKLKLNEAAENTGKLESFDNDQV